MPHFNQPGCADPVSLTSPYFENTAATQAFHIIFPCVLANFSTWPLLFALVEGNLFQNIKVILNSGFVFHLNTEKYPLISGYVQTHTLNFFHLVQLLVLNSSSFSVI